MRIHLTGASGSGVTTLGRALAGTLKAPCFDVDDFYWLPTDPPFSAKRPPEERVRLLAPELAVSSWVLSGSLDSWGDTLVAAVDFVILVHARTQTRLCRLRERERQRFGERILPGGDMAGIHADLIAWAARYDEADFTGRNRQRHERWLAKMRRPALRLDGEQPVQALVKTVLDHLDLRH